ncbi:uncharacterized protein P174DRAFT_154392 [Aspergillus novofumigatus IBT 16806]|uniref:Uncharacterized protein n=1 Tax=Aspergillus novofumigatus (strain IBT 16806) TaxID=1392255 RepID=A0A2I1CEW2_ASPN1|nr:uncharacterized protein P174DRAFT_154392 [Aspergillus novofumigatus IBT 16806]PKX96161.1 hypothetical protein P174DRAFT_154392 [Aspergillus novofumigatus IBT 16806]
MILMTRFHDEAIDLAHFHVLKNCQSGLFDARSIAPFHRLYLTVHRYRVVISYCQFRRCQCPRRCFFPPEGLENPVALELIFKEPYLYCRSKYSLAIDRPSLLSLFSAPPYSRLEQRPLLVLARWPSDRRQLLHISGTWTWGLLRTEYSLQITVRSTENSGLFFPYNRECDPSKDDSYLSTLPQRLMLIGQSSLR